MNRVLIQLHGCDEHQLTEIVELLKRKFQHEPQRSTVDGFIFGYSGTLEVINFWGETPSSQESSSTESIRFITQEIATQPSTPSPSVPLSLSLPWSSMCKTCGSPKPIYEILEKDKVDKYCPICVPLQYAVLNSSSVKVRLGVCGTVRDLGANEVEALLKQRTNI